MRILAEGHGDYLKVDPDGFREYVRDHKQRAMVNKVMTEKEAIARSSSRTATTWSTSATTCSAAPSR